MERSKRESLDEWESLADTMGVPPPAHVPRDGSRNIMLRNPNRVQVITASSIEENGRRSRASAQDIGRTATNLPKPEEL